MDANVIGQAISSWGFPIAACCAMFWYIVKSDESHKEEIQHLTDAVNNNTTVMTKICERMAIYEQQSAGEVPD